MSLTSAIRSAIALLTVGGMLGCATTASRFLPDTGLYESRSFHEPGTSTADTGPALILIVRDQARGVAAASALPQPVPSPTISASSDGEALQYRREGGDVLWIDEGTGAMRLLGRSEVVLPATPSMGSRWETSREGNCASLARITAAARDWIEVTHETTCGTTTMPFSVETWKVGRGLVRISFPGVGGLDIERVDAFTGLQHLPVTTNAPR